MKSWPTKDPDEVLDYKVLWGLELGEDTIASSSFSLVVPAGLVVDSDTFTTTDATIWLSGGDEGEIATVLNTVTTAGGRVMEKGVQIAISSTIPAPAPSGHVRPAPAQIKALYPAFSSVPDATVQAYIDMCPVDDSWFESDYTRAIGLWVAHTMTLNGLGSNEAATQAASGIKSFSSGDLSVSFSESKSSDDGGWGGSMYGKQFYQLLRMNKGGPRSAAACFRVQSGYAKDVPGVRMRGPLDGIA